jgi:hypothetical protein
MVAAAGIALADNASWKERQRQDGEQNSDHGSLPYERITFRRTFRSTAPWRYPAGIRTAVQPGCRDKNLEGR